MLNNFYNNVMLATTNGNVTNGSIDSLLAFLLSANPRDLAIATNYISRISNIMLNFKWCPIIEGRH